MTKVTSILFTIALFLTTVHSTQNTTDVGRYRTFERLIENKFADVDFTCSYTAPSCKKIDSIGFFDGDGKGGGSATSGDIWKIRFLHSAFVQKILKK